jgi:hypothetical protein
MGGKKLKRFSLLMVTIFVLPFCSFSGYVYAQSTLHRQEKCLQGAKNWLNDHSTKGIYEHYNHYNKRLDKCFIRVDYLFDSGSKAVGVEDVFEWKAVGSFFETEGGAIMRCYVESKTCSNRTEFEALIKPYMEE